MQLSTTRWPEDEVSLQERLYIVRHDEIVEKTHGFVQSGRRMAYSEANTIHRLVFKFVYHVMYRAL